MRQRTFVWSLGTVLGSEPGWLPVEAGPGWFPGPGFLSAHDTMEHLSNKADWAHELRAAGVAAFDVPGVSHRSVDSIADDVVGFAARDYHFEVPPAPPMAHRPLHATEEAAVQKLMDAIGKRIRLALDNAALRGARVPAEDKKLAPTFVERATPWIRLGFRAAERVYGKGKRTATGNLMQDIREAINENHNADPPLTGDKLTVTVDPKAKTFTIKRENGNTKLSKEERLNQAVMDEFGARLGILSRLAGL